MHRTAPTHATHDELLLARLYGGDVDETERSRALDQMASCQDCADVFADLGAIAVATAALPTPPRPRDFTLTEADASAGRSSTGSVERRRSGARWWPPAWSESCSWEPFRSWGRAAGARRSTGNRSSMRRLRQACQGPRLTTRLLRLWSRTALSVPRLPSWARLEPHRPPAAGLASRRARPRLAVRLRSWRSRPKNQSTRANLFSGRSPAGRVVTRVARPLRHFPARALPRHLRPDQMSGNLRSRASPAWRSSVSCC